MIKDYIIRFFKSLKTQFLQVDENRKLSTFLVTVTVLGEVAFIVLLNRLTAEFPLKFVLFGAGLLVWLRFKVEWPLAEKGKEDQELQNQANGRNHVLMMLGFFMVPLVIIKVVQILLG